MYSKFNLNEVDVIIIGAGISGLTTAFYILQKEPTLTVILLEANDRIGGRIMSEEVKINNNETSRFDLGGQYFFKTQYPLIRLLNTLNIEFEESKNSSEKLLGVFAKNVVKTSMLRPPQFGNVILNVELVKFFSELEALSDHLYLNDPYAAEGNEALDNISMENYINDKLFFTMNRNYIRTYLKIICGVDSNTVSVLYFVAYCNSTFGVGNHTYISNKFSNKCWINGGAYTICEKLMEIIGKENVITNCAVYKVDWTEKYVLVKTNKANYKCDYAVIAVPPKQILNIKFIPLLSPTKIYYLNNMLHGSAIKFVATYSNAFWKTKNLSGDIIFNYFCPLLACFNMEVCKTPALGGYINPEFILNEGQSYKSVVLNELSQYFGNDVLQPLDYAEKNWANEIYCGGCPLSVPGINTLRKLFWTSSDTSFYCNGHMAGAVHSAYTTAMDVLSLIRPQTITTNDIVLLKPPPILPYRQYRDTFYHKYVRQKYVIPICLIGILIIVYIKRRIKNPV